jgi:hypothetical protein
VEAHAPALQPRLTVRVALAPAVASLTAAGLAYQYPTLRVGALPAMVVSVPGFPVGQRRLQRAAQVSQGIELALPADIAVTATGFLTSWSGMTDLTSHCLQVMPPTAVPNGMPEPYVCPDDQPVSGLAYGGELLVRRDLTRRLGGWLSYTVSRSTRDAHFATPSGETASARVPSENDRTHVLGAILAYQLAERWRAGVRASFHTGAPYSVLAGNVPVPPYNAHRAPAFFRLDVRLERRWSLGQGRSLSFIVEGQNVTFSRDTSPLFLECRGEASPMLQTTQCVQGRTPPLTIPSLGLEARF